MVVVRYYGFDKIPVTTTKNTKNTKNNQTEFKLQFAAAAQPLQKTRRRARYEIAFRNAIALEIIFPSSPLRSPCARGRHCGVCEIQFRGQVRSQVQLGNEFEAYIGQEIASVGVDSYPRASSFRGCLDSYPRASSLWAFCVL